jgi:protoheme IX farnesyltransferase
MLPVVAGEKETRRQILLYAVLLYMVTQLPFCAGAFGVFYLVASMLLGLGFIGGAVWLYRAPGARGPSQQGAAVVAVGAGDAAIARRRALKLYLYSLAYLALLFAAMVADVKL